MNVDALLNSQVNTTTPTPSALRISRTTLSTVRTGVRAGATAYMRRTYV